MPRIREIIDPEDDRRRYKIANAGDGSTRSWPKTLWRFDLEYARGVLVWSDRGSLEDALEELAGAFSDWGWHGYLTTQEELGDLFKEACAYSGLAWPPPEDLYNDPAYSGAMASAEDGLIYTESGYIPNLDRCQVSEVHPGSALWVRACVATSLEYDRLEWDRWEPPAGFPCGHSDCEGSPDVAKVTGLKEACERKRLGR